MAEKHHFSSLMVGLDLSEMDDTLIRFAEMMSRICQIEHIYFVHIVRDLEIPDEILEQYPDLKPPPPVDEGLQQQFTTLVTEAFGDTSTKLDVIVQEGHPIEQFSRLAKTKDVDLIMMGRKKELKGSGIVSSKIARSSHCSLILVPEEPKYTISNILVPIDFSDHSKLSLSAALNIAKQTGAHVETVHIYEVPSGYHTTGKSYEEFAEIMKGHAERDFARFMKEGDFHGDIHCTYLLHDHVKNVKLVNELAHSNGTDLIVVGSRGRTKAATILIGSMAEKLAYIDNDIPLLIAKNKGENMGFFQAIMRI